MKNQGISIIGTGALGRTLALALAKAGFSIVSLFNRHKEKAQQLALEAHTSKTGSFPQKKSDLGKVIFITVPDRHIKGVAVKLAKLEADFTDFFIIHCSGNKSSGVLDPLQKKGASIASFHPLQTFTSSSNLNDLSGIYFDIEGDREGIAFLKGLTKMLKSRCIEINPSVRPCLHAAAVMASNYMVALVECAGQVAQIGGMDKDEARQALMPLVQKSVENIANSNQLKEALSGPVARGDVSTITEHIKLLEQDPRLLTLYKQLGSILIDISKPDTTYSDAQLNKLSKLLNEQ